MSFEFLKPDYNGSNPWASLRLRKMKGYLGTSAKVEVLYNPHGHNNSGLWTEWSKNDLIYLEQGYGFTKFDRHVLNVFYSEL